MSVAENSEESSNNNKISQFPKLLESFAVFDGDRSLGGLVVSNDGRYAVATGVGGAYFVRDGKSGAAVKKLRIGDDEEDQQNPKLLGGGAAWSGLAFSQDSSLLTVVDHQKILRVFAVDGVNNMKEGDFKQIAEIDTQHSASSEAVAFSPDNSLIVTGGWDKQMKCFDWKNSNKELYSVTQSTKVQCVVFLDNERIATCETHSPNDLCMFEARTGKLISKTPHCHTDSVFQMKHVPHLELLITCSHDKTFKGWSSSLPSSSSSSSTTTESESSFTKYFEVRQETHVFSVDVTQDGGLISVGGFNGSISLFTLKKNRAVEKKQKTCYYDENNKEVDALFSTFKIWKHGSESKDHIYRCVFSHDQTRLFTGDVRGKLRVYRIPRFTWESRKIVFEISTFTRREKLKEALSEWRVFRMIFYFVPISYPISLESESEKTIAKK